MQPIVDEGWFMVKENRLLLSYMDQRVTSQSFQRHISALARDIDDWSAGTRAVFYEAPAPFAMSAEQRRQIAEVLDARKTKLQQITAGYAMVTPSTVVRGLLTAVFWIAPPPYAHKVLATPHEGFRWLAERCPWIDPAQSLERYQRIKGELLVRMGPKARVAERA